MTTTQDSTRWQKQFWKVVLILGGVLFSAPMIALTRASNIQDTWKERLTVSVPLCVVGALLVLIAFPRWTRALVTLQRPALEVLKEVQATGQHYVVYLRTFDTEAPGFGNTDLLTGVMHLHEGGTALESGIIRGFADLPVFGLADPRMPSAMGGMYRIESSNETWLEDLRPLLSGAAFVVVYYTKRSPGVARELNELTSLGLKEKSVIIVGDGVWNGKPQTRPASIMDELEQRGHVVLESEGFLDEGQVHVRLEKWLPNVYSYKRALST